MANEQNLKPQSTRTKKEQREIAKKGGIASGEARRQKKTLKEALNILLEHEMKAKNGETMTGAEAITVQVFNKALKGDLRAYEIIRDTAGQRPTDRVAMEVGTKEKDDALHALLKQLGAGNDDKSGKS